MWGWGQWIYLKLATQSPTYCYLWEYRNILFYLFDTMLSNIHILYKKPRYKQLKIMAAEQMLKELAMLQCVRKGHPAVHMPIRLEAAF
jgi:hypothetical protein